LEEECVTLQIKLLSTTYLSIKQLAEEQGWDEEKSLRFLIDKGLADFQTERLLGTESNDEKTLLRRLADCEGRYSAMKFRAFSLERDNQTLQFKVAGLEGSVEMWKSWSEQVKQRLFELSQENQSLRDQLSQLETKALNVPMGSTNNPGFRSFWQRIRSWIIGR